ncbi:long-chain fatty acid transport protein 6 [Denticeps clupeoides]|uniref:long-chain-fatty-acid--CoA ligase n=1 Tax=Denticeps clupeoides TaxID=299321 RepID=A0AAY4B7I6_9TELE|nr:long-chain fatty acid transport protein 6-like [Denticeps clupeoides]
MTWLLTTAAAGLVALLALQRLLWPHFWQDLGHCLALRRVGAAARRRMRSGVLTYLDCFAARARRSAEKPFILFEGQVLTYRDVDERSNRVARVFRGERGLKRGDVVALLMSNEPDFVCVWFGLSKLGCEVAFLNFNIKAKSLLHCFRSCGARTLVVGSDLVSSREEELLCLKEDGVDLWVVDKSSSLAYVSPLLEKVDQTSGEGLPAEDLPRANLMSNFLFIFTSGTTGLPKAARLSHLKAVMCMSFLRLCGATSGDNIYVPLPLYHMSASLLGIGGCIELGATCVLKRKFSASQFWKDCQKYNVTVFQYVGELCRYLINQPKAVEEASHSVRIAAGSGLRADVWRDFAKRFGKIQIREAYGLTEASIGFLNYTREIGPIGRGGYFNKRSMPFEILKCDLQSCEPVRTESGQCLKVNKGETGLLVAPVSAMNPFLGYAGNKEMSDKKLLRDVFRKGDIYFNTGDLMLQDHRDFVYFRDRIGDTFRWKGENVATTEVSEILGSLDFLQDVNVYGVSVPGYEGRAGMAAIVLKPEHSLDGQRLHGHLVQNLPAYAWPWFLRVQTSLDLTETFKQQKGKLVEEGFSPEAVQEPLYFLDVSQKDYIPLTQTVYEDIISGKIRL